jgi:hypothetical protein
MGTVAETETRSIGFPLHSQIDLRREAFCDFSLFIVGYGATSQLLCRASQRDQTGCSIPACFWRNAGSAPPVKYSRKMMTSQELLLALADGETLELARKMIGKPRLAFLLAKQAIGPEGETSLDAEAVAQILGVHKRHAYRLIKSASCQTKKKSQSTHKRITNGSQKSHNMSQPEGS